MWSGGAVDPEICTLLWLVNDYTPTIPCTEYTLDEKMSPLPSSYTYTIGEPALIFGKPAVGVI